MVRTSTTAMIVQDKARLEATQYQGKNLMTRWLLVVACLLLTVSVEAFQTPGSSKTKRLPATTEPKLPGAITRVPEGVGSGAPFDVAAYFAAPPAGLNAAAVYLDALFEFDPGMAICFPEGAETTRRKQIAARRMKSLRDQHQALTKDPASVDVNAIDRVVADLEMGMRKVEDAQRRPRCVFQSGVDYTAPLPHAQAVREVGRLIMLRTRRKFDRGNVDQPLHDLSVLLRLVRDVRPRQATICQLVASAMTAFGYDQVIRPLLASPQFHERHARQLLKMLAKHEEESIKGYEEAFMYEYACMRLFMNDTVKDPGTAIAMVIQMYKALGIAFVGENDPQIQIWKDEIKKTTPARINKVNTQVNQYFRDLLVLKNTPGSQWLGKEPRPNRIIDGSFYSKIPALLMPNISNLGESEARNEVQVRAAECLIAIKLWKYRNKKVPADLAIVTKAAGLPRVPLDSYSGLPLRMALINGEPVVYSVGKDGRDDGGRIDSELDRKAGDQLYRLPALETGKR